MLHALILALAFSLAQAFSFDELITQITMLPPAARAHHVERYLDGRHLPIVESDTLLTFIWYGVADSVFVNGALQDGWGAPARMASLPCTDSARGATLYYKRYVVPRDARLEYKFIVNGTHILDPANIRLTPEGDFSNSEAVMPGFVRTPYTAYRAEREHGAVDTILFAPKDTTIRPRKVFVFIPPGYAGQQDLPSVYVHDGETALRHMCVTTILENMIADGSMVPVIAVFVPFVERNEEYLGPKHTRYVNALADELVPMVDGRYRTAREAQRRGTMGISNGGHLALAMGLARPDVFGACAGQSSTITPVLNALTDMRLRSAPLPKWFRVYQQCGRYDIVDAQYRFLDMNREFSRLLARLNIRHVYVETSDGHDWPSWRERVPDILRFFFMPN
ncbi:MAG: hypothetical protein IT282_05335 [Bacteroidetes bacterium]|nr:hypothetical protein [Bacteroidota bacterium]